MDRRNFLTLSAVAASSALLLPAVDANGETAFASTTSKPRYPSGTIFQLPGKTNQVAWTVDDGAGLTAMQNYIDMLNATDTRLTFFVTSNNSPWRALRKQLRPLAESGRVQFANHTRSHRDLTKLTNSQIQGELRDCGNFIRDEFGVEPAPIFRPPYGYYDKRVMAAASAVGYRTAMMWYGSLGDGGNITDRHRLKLASEWMNAGHIVIAHANQATPPGDLLKIRNLIDKRGLETVTLDDVWRA